jgi:hypothetical protein
VIADLNTTGDTSNWAFYCSVAFALALAFFACFRLFCCVRHHSWPSDSSLFLPERSRQCPFSTGGIQCPHMLAGYNTRE